MRYQSVQRTDEDIECMVRKYSNMLFKICFSMLCNKCDAEDAVQNTFLKYISKSPVFTDEEHKKSWLIRVAVNSCNDIGRTLKRNKHMDIDELKDYAVSDNDTNILEDIMSLAPKYKSVIHLFYIESYKTDEIAQILGISPSAVRKRLQYARSILREGN